MEPKDFGWALRALKNGKRVQRSGWNGKGGWLELQRPDEHSKMSLPYLFLNLPREEGPRCCDLVPWVANQTDILSEDWAVID